MSETEMPLAKKNALVRVAAAVLAQGLQDYFRIKSRPSREEWLDARRFFRTGDYAVYAGMVGDDMAATCDEVARSIREGREIDAGRVFKGLKGLEPAPFRREKKAKRRVSEEENRRRRDVLLKFHSTKTAKELAEMTGLTANAVQARLWYMGLKAKPVPLEERNEAFRATMAAKGR